MTQGSVQISNEQYHKPDGAISSTMVKTMHKVGPWAFWNTYYNPKRPERKTSPALTLGSLTHCAVLEPDELKKQFMVVSSRATKKGKEEAKQAKDEGLTAVTQSDLDLAFAMRDAVHADKQAKLFLESGAAEKSWWSVDEATGLDIKARTDWVTKRTIVDLKTTRSGAAPDEFAKAVANFGYHIQAEHYLQTTGLDRFVFLVVQSEFPFDVALYELDQDAMDEGARARRKALDQISECQIADHWPGHSETGVQSLSLPRWAFSKTTPN